MIQMLAIVVVTVVVVSVGVVSIVVVTIAPAFVPARVAFPTAALIMETTCCEKGNAAHQCEGTELSYRCDADSVEHDSSFYLLSLNAKAKRVPPQAIPSASLDIRQN